MMGEGLGRLGNIRLEIEVLQETLALQPSLGDPGFEACANFIIGLAYKDVGDLDEALAHLDRAVTIQRTLGDRVAEANTLMGLGLVQEFRGNFQAALTSFRRALSVTLSVGDRNAEAICLAGRAVFLGRGPDETAGPSRVSRAEEQRRHWHAV